MMLERASSRLRFVTPSVSGTTTHSAISPAGPLRHLGASVVVSAEGRPNVRGWLWRETPDGIYVALDKEAEEIRFV
jgi:hypothetical protein